jgi:hypothetical protein
MVIRTELRKRGFHTFLLRIGEFDGRKFRVRILLLSHRDEGGKTECLKRFSHPGMTHAMHGGIHELQRTRPIKVAADRQSDIAE